MYGEEIFEKRRGNLKLEIGKEHVLRIDPLPKAGKESEVLSENIKGNHNSHHRNHG